MRIKRTVLTFLVLGTLACGLMSCGKDSTIDILDSVPELDASREVSTEASAPDPPPAEGQTAMPSVVQCYNSGQRTVVIAGRCENGATVTASAVGERESRVKASGEVFVIEVAVGTTKDANIQLKAQAPGKSESEAKVVVHGYHSVAEGNLVYPTVLADGVTLFLQSSLDVLGDGAVRTNTAVDAFVTRINGYVNSLKSMGKTELIYVLMPSKASGLPDSLPEGAKPDKGVTLYDQAVAAIGASGATLIDMKAYIAKKEAEDGLADYPLFYRTHSVWSEYGAYLTYEALMEHIAKEYPAAAPRPLGDFEVREVKDALGGDLACHFGLDPSLVRETYCEFVPKFDLKTGDRVPDGVEMKKPHLISDVKKYVNAGEDDFRFYNAYFAGKQIYNDPAFLRVDDSFGFFTGREALPTALFYRDEATYSIVDILAERFDNCMFEKALSLNVTAAAAMDYASEGKKNVDYIVVMVSEDNLPKLIPNND